MMLRWQRLLLSCVALCGILAMPASAQTSAACPAGTLFLTIDTGWGREAERIAEILRRRDIRATLFVAHEPTHRGDRSLDPAWAEFWRAGCCGATALACTGRDHHAKYAAAR